MKCFNCTWYETFVSEAKIILKAGFRWIIMWKFYGVWSIIWIIVLYQNAHRISNQASGKNKCSSLLTWWDDLVFFLTNYFSLVIFHHTVFDMPEPDFNHLFYSFSGQQFQLKFMRFCYREILFRVWHGVYLVLGRKKRRRGSAWAWAWACTLHKARLYRKHHFCKVFTAFDLVCCTLTAAIGPS